MQARDRYDSLIQYYAKKHGLDWQLVKRQVEAESSFRPDAVSRAGAVGLMQFMPQAWKEWGRGKDPRDPEASIAAGCAYMAWLLGRFKEIPDARERYKFALAAYNAGRGHINTALSIARQNYGHPYSYAAWREAGSPPGPWQQWAYTAMFLERVTGRHSAETLRYVKKIMEG